MKRQVRRAATARRMGVVMMARPGAYPDSSDTDGGVPQVAVIVSH